MVETKLEPASARGHCRDAVVVHTAPNRKCATRHQGPPRSGPHDYQDSTSPISFHCSFGRQLYSVLPQTSFSHIREVSILKSFPNLLHCDLITTEGMSFSFGSIWKVPGEELDEFTLGEVKETRKMRNGD